MQIKPLKLPLSHEDICQILPHRFPFLFIDSVSELEPKKHIKAHLEVKAEEPFFAGHFPGFPIMPGVLQVEAIAQAGGILTFFSGVFDAETDIALLVGIEKAKFRKPVFPGSTLDLTAEIMSIKGGICKIKGAAFINNEKTCEAIVTAAIRKK